MDDKDEGTVMYSSEEVEHTLDEVFMTDTLRASRKREIDLLKEELSGIYEIYKAPLKILDIGIGDGYVPLQLGDALLRSIESYIGIDNSEREVRLCERTIRKAGLEDKIHVRELDAMNLKDAALPGPFHAIVCTFFTPGNFRPTEIRLEEDASGRILEYPKEVLSPNKNFQQVFKDAYAMLSSGGKLILGSTYIDSAQTRARQEEFYRKCGMHIITSDKDEFTATREGFWSERFTEEKLYRYLDWLPRENIALIPLDTEGFARTIVITKS